MKTLHTITGIPFQVDDDTWSWAKHHEWHLRNGSPTRYVPVQHEQNRFRSDDTPNPGFPYALHRELLDFPLVIVTFRDGNPLNLQKDNLATFSPGATLPPAPPVRKFGERLPIIRRKQ